ncbi:MAG: hypothetical protein POH28_09695 [Acidocella sp.]|nr:hypothetical protein [Acidocella sp.]
MTKLLGGPTADSITGSLVVVTTRASKQALHRDTSATAVDLESAIVARIASERGIPFAVLRAVADPAWRALPPASLSALNASGHIVFWPIFKNIMRQPGQLPDLFRLARDAAVARASLAKHVSLLKMDLQI